MSTLKRIPRTPIGLACLALAAPLALAQNTVAPAGPPATVVITGNPLRNAPGTAGQRAGR